MAKSITEYINNIRKAIFGKDVREAIASAIEQCYTDASEKDNANMEVKQARGEYDTLDERLNNSDSNISKLTNTIDNINAQTTKYNEIGEYTLLASNLIIDLSSKFPTHFFQGMDCDENYCYVIHMENDASVSYCTKILLSDNSIVGTYELENSKGSHGNSCCCYNGKLYVVNLRTDTNIDVYDSDSLKFEKTVILSQGTTNCTFTSICGKDGVYYDVIISTLPGNKGIMLYYKKGNDIVPVTVITPSATREYVQGITATEHLIYMSYSYPTSSANYVYPHIDVINYAGEVLTKCYLDVGKAEIEDVCRISLDKTFIFNTVDGKIYKTEPAILTYGYNAETLNGCSRRIKNYVTMLRKSNSFIEDSQELDNGGILVKKYTLNPFADIGIINGVVGSAIMCNVRCDLIYYSESQKIKLQLHNIDKDVVIIGTAYYEYNSSDRSFTLSEVKIYKHNSTDGTDSFCYTIDDYIQGNYGSLYINSLSGFQSFSGSTNINNWE